MVISDNSRALQWGPGEVIIRKIDGLFAVRPSFGTGQSQSQAQGCAKNLGTVTQALCKPGHILLSGGCRGWQTAWTPRPAVL